MGLRVRAVVLFEFQCPKCKNWYSEGNPLECPHQEGRGVKYKPSKGDKLINVQAVIRKLGLSEEPATTPAKVARPDPKPDMVSGSVPVISSVQDLVDLQCPKGT